MNTNQPGDGFVPSRYLAQDTPFLLSLCRVTGLVIVNVALHKSYQEWKLTRSYPNLQTSHSLEVPLSDWPCRQVCSRIHHAWSMADDEANSAIVGRFENRVDFLLYRFPTNIVGSSLSRYLPNNRLPRSLAHNWIYTSRLELELYSAIPQYQSVSRFRKHML